MEMEDVYMTAKYTVLFIVIKIIYTSRSVHINLKALEISLF